MSGVNLADTSSSIAKFLQAKEKYHLHNELKRGKKSVILAFWTIHTVCLKGQQTFKMLTLLLDKYFVQYQSPLFWHFDLHSPPRT